MNRLGGALCIILTLVVALQAGAGFDSSTGQISDARWKSGVPLGGIGCGAVELLTDGAFGNATTNHNWDRPTGVLRGSFAAVRCETNGIKTARILRGAWVGEYQAAGNIAHTRYLGLYPRAELVFEDEGLPVTVSLHAHSPLIPRDVRNSSLPVAFLDFTVTNPGAAVAEVSLALSWENLVGFGGRKDVPWDFTSGREQTPWTGDDCAGILFTSTESFDDMRQNTIGTHFAGVQLGEGVTVTTCTEWDASRSSIPWWGSFAETGRPECEPQRSRVRSPAGVVSASVTLEPGEVRRLHFLVAWHMPTFRMEHRVRDYLGELGPEKDAGRAAFDGDLPSRWATGREKRAGDQFTLDLGRVETVSGLTLDSSPSPSDYPLGYRVELSETRDEWTVAAEATGAEAEQQQAKAVLDIAFEPKRARYIRITNLESQEFWFWSIHELTVHTPTGKADLSRASASARLQETRELVRKSDVGHYFLEQFPEIDSLVNYAVARRERLLEQTREWQDVVLESNLPFWLKLKLINCAFTMYSATVLTRDGRFAVLESPIDMGGALGTMDQRMAAHAFYVQMFPELDESELRLFADCQQEDGRITHFNGNFHEVIGDPRVGYGITDWPDLSASWIMQVLKLYRWTGDRAFLNHMWPHVKDAIDWLRSADEDGDLIPEGGSTYDYEQLPRGAFVYSASCTLGALLAAEEMARVQGEPALAEEYRSRFTALQAAVMKRLWNGEYFIKWRSARTQAENPNSFVAALAGDWLAHLCGLGNTLPPGIAEREVNQLIARHLKPFFPVPPMEVTADGICATSACFLLQHEPYLGCESIYRGYVDDGLEVLRRVYHCAWEQNKSPWDQSLVYDAPGGRQGGLRSYMTCPTSWHVLNALTGVSLDAPGGTLFIAPRSFSADTELHCPVFLPGFWGQVDYAPRLGKLTLSILKTFDDCEVTIRQVARDGKTRPIRLASEFHVEAGQVLDLSSHITALAPFPVSKQVKWVAAPSPDIHPGLKPDGWTLTASVPGSRQASETDTAAAIDRETGTRWTTGRAMRPGDWLQVDLGETRRIQGIWLDIAHSKLDYPRGYEVRVSPDGETWQTVARASEGASRRSVRHGIWRCEFSPVDARFVRIIQTGWDSYYWWSVHEWYVLPEGFQRPVPTGKPTNVQIRREK